MEKLKILETLDIMNYLFSGAHRINSFEITSLEREDAEKYDLVLSRYFTTEINESSIGKDRRKKQSLYSVIALGKKPTLGVSNA